MPKKLINTKHTQHEKHDLSVVAKTFLWSPLVEPGFGCFFQTLASLKHGFLVPPRGFVIGASNSPLSGRA